MTIASLLAVVALLLSAATYYKCAWNKFYQLLPLLTNLPLLKMFFFFQNVLKESDAACSRELGNDSGFTELPLA